jgi:DNA mismatch repair protein MutL
VTSKISKLEDLEQNLKTFGYRGEALASIGHISTLTILSHHHTSYETFSKIISFGTQRNVSISTLQRPKGTTIMITDAFAGKLQNTVQNSKSHRKQVISHFFRVSLPYVGAIRFILKDTASQKILFSNQISENEFEEKMQAISQYSDLESKHLEFFIIRSEHLEGIVSKQLFHESNDQFLYYNKRILSNSQIIDYVHGFYNKSTFGKVEKEFPKFYLNIKLDASDFDITSDLTKKSPVITV